MKNKILKTELAKLIDEIDDWEAEMQLNHHTYIPPYAYVSIEYDTLKSLRAKGLATFSLNNENKGGELENVKITPKGYTYIEDERNEWNKWIIRTVIVGAFSSVITSIITSLVINLLLLR